MRCICGEPLVAPTRGRFPRFCSDACRVRAYRRRKQGLAEDIPKWEKSRGRKSLREAEEEKWVKPTN